MRKTIAIVGMVLAFLSLASFTAAEKVKSIDLSKYSDEEIITLYNSVQQEIVDRHIEKTANLYAGSYLVGKDIPAGSYILHAEYEGSAWMNVFIYADGGDGEELFTGYVFSADNQAAQMRGEGTWSIVLHEGELLKCTGEVSLTISTGIKFN